MPQVPQASGETIAVLQERGYVTRDTDPRHARRMRLQVTPLGFEVLRTGEAIFDELRDQWQRQIGPAQLQSLETHLTELVGTPPCASTHPAGCREALASRSS